MGDLEGCAKVIKWLHFIFNTIFWLVGCAILGLGIWLYVEFGNFLSDIIGVSWLSAPIILITVGSIIAVLGFLGCCGAVMENARCLYAFGSLLCIVLALEITAGAVGYAKRGDLDDTLVDDLETTQESYNTDTIVKEAWDRVQKDFTCCGTNNYTDWYDIDSFSAANLPISCCDGDPTVCTAISARTRGGCHTVIKQKIEDNIIPVGIAVLVLGIIQLIGIAFAFHLACTICGNKSEVV